jgi:hypothetical protein
MSEGFDPIHGKCLWWRELPLEEDRFDSRLKPGERRVTCSCFVEGKFWTLERDAIPADCPDSKHCRYFIKHH